MANDHHGGTGRRGDGDLFILGKRVELFIHGQPVLYVRENELVPPGRYGIFDGRMLNWIVPSLSFEEVRRLRDLMAGTSRAVDATHVALRRWLPEAIAPCGHSHCMADPELGRACARAEGDTVDGARTGRRKEGG